MKKKKKKKKFYLEKTSAFQFELKNSKIAMHSIWESMGTKEIRELLKMRMKSEYQKDPNLCQHCQVEKTSDHYLHCPELATSRQKHNIESQRNIAEYIFLEKKRIQRSREQLKMWITYFNEVVAMKEVD